MPPPQSGNVRTSDGLYLCVREELVERPRLTLAMIHGYAEHGGRYLHVQRALAEFGISSLTVDVRGHGRSEGRRGFVARFDDYHKDVNALLALARERAEGGPVAIFGHSNGGLIVTSWLLRHAEPALAGVVLSSPFFGLGWKISAPALFFSDWMARLWPKSTLPTTLQGEYLCRDAEIQRSRAQDALVLRRVNANWFREVRQAQVEVLARTQELHVPMLVLYGGDDRVADSDATDRFVQSIAGPNVEAERLAGMYHEIVNEPERDVVIAKMAHWLLRLAPQRE